MALFSSSFDMMNSSASLLPLEERAFGRRHDLVAPSPSARLSGSCALIRTWQRNRGGQNFYVVTQIADLDEVRAQRRLEIMQALDHFGRRVSALPSRLLAPRMPRPWLASRNPSRAADLRPTTSKRLGPAVLLFPASVAVTAGIS
jgi:hypothetical protein